MAPTLLVDDDEDWTVALQEYFDLLALPLVIAHDGREALRLLRDGLRPAVIVLDLEMPGMSGTSFRFGQLAEADGASVPLIVCSGASDAQAIAALLGANACFDKPVSPLLLARTVQRLGEAHDTSA